MTETEFDALVRQVGDQILAQVLAPKEGQTLPKTRQCACELPQGETLNSPEPPAPLLDEAISSGELSKEELAKRIDHTLLRPEAGESAIVGLCREARSYGFAAVCVQPAWVARAVRELWGSGVKVATVVGFPHGATTTPAKCFEAEQALKLGARELDMVMNIGALKSGDLDRVYSDIRSVVELAHQAGAAVKVILEMALLSQEEKMKACAVARLAGADWVKTSTGFGPSGADPRDVSLMRRVVGETMGVKAAGGIRSWEQARQMVQAGAGRIGTSAGVRILSQAAAETAAPSK